MNPARALAVLVFCAGLTTLWAQPVPEFHLPDVNPNSPRYNTEVSPRDYLLQVSGYYFGAAH